MSGSLLLAGVAEELLIRGSGPGFKEMFTGVGHTVVEGAKFSGKNIKEFFAPIDPSLQ